MENFRRLTNLRDCRLGAPVANAWRPHRSDRRISSEAVASVSGLQQLSLLSFTSAPIISSTTAPGLSTLTARRDLSLIDCTSFMPAGVIEPMTALTRLLMQDVKVNLPQLLQLLPLLQ